MRTWIVCPVMKAVSEACNVSSFCLFTKLLRHAESLRWLVQAEVICLFNDWQDHWTARLWFPTRNYTIPGKLPVFHNNVSPTARRSAKCEVPFLSTAMLLLYTLTMDTRVCVAEYFRWVCSPCLQGHHQPSNLGSGLHSGNLAPINLSWIVSVYALHIVGSIYGWDGITRLFRVYTTAIIDEHN